MIVSMQSVIQSVSQRASERMPRRQIATDRRFNKRAHTHNAADHEDGRTDGLRQRDRHTIGG